ncbi:MAG: RHS repeat-associated core domain-containing protein [Ardenticatenales bacterium]|nr:RHS repeat-associated core domain-containing protein [Ardenticatenales bacterium]
MHVLTKRTHQTEYPITQRSVYFLGGQAIAVRQVVEGGPTNTLHLHTDHLGSTSIMSYNGGGGVVASSTARYLPFGDYRIAPTQTYTDRGFTGQKHNDGLGLIYYNARYYLPGVGRFVNADTIVPDAGIPQSFNRYSYGYNNPVKYSDPTGHLSVDEINAYFGEYQNEQEMIEAGYSEELVYWLFDEDVMFGDVFTYESGEAMLVLFEANEAGSEVYIGGFYGLNGNREGQQVYASNIGWLNDHTPEARELEDLYFDNWENLPTMSGSDGTPYYIPSTYVNTLTWEAGLAGVGIVGGGALVTGCIISVGCAGAFATGTAIVGSGSTIIGTAAAMWDVLTPDKTLFDVYPTILLPEMNVLGQLEYKAPRHFHITAPEGIYE